MIAKSLFIWPIGLIMLGTLFLQSGRAYLATNGPASPTLTELKLTTHCQQPCWQGIQPGITITEDKTQLPESTYFSVNYYTSESGLVRDISLYGLQSIRLGDLLLIWGPPSHIVPYRTLLPHSNLDTAELYFGTGYEIYFHDSLVVVSTVAAKGPITPDHRIQAIHYYQPSEYGPPRRLNSPAWRGFFVDYPIMYVAGGE